MKKCLIALFAVFVCATASADPSLIGSWKSSHDLSMAFIRDNVRLQAKTERFLDQLLGNMTLHFDAQTISNDFPDIMVDDIKGVPHQMEGFRDQVPYKALFSNDRMVVVQTEEVTIYHFVDDDTMWVYCCAISDTIPLDLHIREYFVRVK
jgi:hypothetical protein